jgi:hypothetical protein
LSKSTSVCADNGSGSGSIAEAAVAFFDLLMDGLDLDYEQPSRRCCCALARRSPQVKERPAETCNTRHISRTGQCLRRSSMKRYSQRLTHDSSPVRNWLRAKCGSWSGYRVFVTE